MTAPAAPPIRRAAGPPRRLVVDGSAIPAWVKCRCNRSGRSVVTGPVDAVVTACATGDSLLIPHAESPQARPRVVAALRSLPDDASVLVDALDAATHLDGRLSVLHAVPLSFGERTVGRTEALRHGHEVLDEARALVDGPGDDVGVEVGLVRAWPHEIVGELLDADLLVLGGPRTGSLGRVGLVAASAIRHSPCAVLLAPRPAFPPPVSGYRADWTAL
jgi:nucleotide-binding universal stress UspA family protein